MQNNVNRLLSVLLVTCLMGATVISACVHTPLDKNGKPIDPTAPITPGPGQICFETQVLPIFISTCAKPGTGCHDAGSAAEGIVLDNYANIMAGGEGIVPGSPSSSKYYRRMTTTNTGSVMPPAPYPRLDAAQLAIINQWISEGAQNTTNCGCDSTKFSYSGSIKPLMTSYCTGCHSGSSPSAGVDLSNYTNVKNYVDNGQLWGTVKHNPGFHPMPKGGAMFSACQLSQINQWIAAGAPNN